MLAKLYSFSITHIYIFIEWKTNINLQKQRCIHGPFKIAVYILCTRILCQGKYIFIIRIEIRDGKYFHIKRFCTHRRFPSLPQVEFAKFAFAPVTFCIQNDIAWREGTQNFPIIFIYLARAAVKSITIILLISTSDKIMLTMFYGTTLLNMGFFSSP